MPPVSKVFIAEVDMHTAFRNRQGKSASVRAIFAYCDWCISHSDVPSGLTDFQQSGIELINGIPHAVVRTIEGDVLATYRIRTDGRLRRSGRKT